MRRFAKFASCKRLQSWAVAEEQALELGVVFFSTTGRASSHQSKSKFGRAKPGRAKPGRARYACNPTDHWSHPFPAALLYELHRVVFGAWL